MPMGDPSAKGEPMAIMSQLYPGSVQTTYWLELPSSWPPNPKGMWKNHVTARDHWKHPWDLTWCSDFIQTWHSIGDRTVLWCCLANPSWIISPSNSVLPKKSAATYKPLEHPTVTTQMFEHPSNPQHPIWQGISSSAASVYSQCLISYGIHGHMAQGTQQGGTKICFPSASTVRAWSLVALYLPNSYEKNNQKDIWNHLRARMITRCSLSCQVPCKQSCQEDGISIDSRCYM